MKSDEPEGHIVIKLTRVTGWLVKPIEHLCSDHEWVSVEVQWLTGAQANLTDCPGVCTHDTLDCTRDKM